MRRHCAEGAVETNLRACRAHLAMTMSLAMIILHAVTDRLCLTPITFADSDRLALFHADARVMSHLKHGVLSRPQSDSMVADYEAEWAALGFVPGP